MFHHLVFPLLFKGKCVTTFALEKKQSMADFPEYAYILWDDICDIIGILKIGLPKLRSYFGPEISNTLKG